MQTAPIHTRLAGFLLLLAGWVILLSAPMLLSASGPRSLFVGAGLLVELFGIGMIGRHHRNYSGRQQR